jgi:hypothetical protein
MLLGMSGVDRIPGEVARAFARRVRSRDPAAASLIDVETRRLVEGTEEAIADEREALAEFGGGFHFAELNSNVLAAEDGGTLHVWCYDNDLVSLGHRSMRLGARRHSIDALRRLRELFARRSPRLVRSFHLMLFGPTEPFEEYLESLDARDMLSHLALRREHAEPLSPLAGVFPALEALDAAAEDLHSLLGEEHPSLATLVVRADEGARVALPYPESVPALRHLGLREGCVDEESVAAVLGSRLVAQLESLEMTATNRSSAFAFDVLLDHRAKLGQLRNIVVGGHLVPERVLRRFKSWPEVMFISHDRREALALDLETTGWPFGAR